MAKFLTYRDESRKSSTLIRISKIYKIVLGKASSGDNYLITICFNGSAESIKLETKRLLSIEEIMEFLENAEKSSKYSVEWTDLEECLVPFKQALAVAY